MTTRISRTPAFASASTLALASTLSLAALMLTGCKAVGPDYTEPTIAAPAAWSSELPPFARTPAAPGADATSELARWWTVFNDAALSSLIDRAVAGNLDLKSAVERVREARAARGIVAAGDKPSVDATGGYSRSAQSENTGNIPGNDLGKGRDLFEAGFDARWELDIFGGTRRAVEAADADIASAEWAARDVRVTIIGEVARNYVELRTSQQRLEIAKQNVQAQQQTLELTESRLRAGLTSELDVTRARSQLATTRATIPGLEGAIRRSTYALSVLTGQNPGALIAELAPVGQIPAIPAALPIDVPTDAIRRRADVRAAERSLAAASARIGVATAELYPSFSLNGAIGLATKNVGNFFDGDSRTWSIGPGVRWNILDFGRIRGNIAVQESRTAQALSGYEASVLTALREVDSAVVGFSSSWKQSDILSEAVAAQQRAVELSTKLYREGLADFISVLDTQRQLFLLQDQLVESRGTTTLNLVELYKSLGGGWEEAPAQK